MFAASINRAIIDLMITKDKLKNWSQSDFACTNWKKPKHLSERIANDLIEIGTKYPRSTQYCWVKLLVINNNDKTCKYKDENFSTYFIQG
jgi:hypothetical protein